MAERTPRRRWLLATLLLLPPAAWILVFHSGHPSPVPRARGYNLIIINIDALRADHLGCHGYPKPTTPFIDRLAREGILFQNARSNSSYTRESVTTLFTGSLPSGGNIPGWRAAPGPDQRTLAEIFSGEGYATALLCNNTFALRDPAFARGFETTWFNPLDQLSQNAPALTARAGDLIQKWAGEQRPFMLYLHYLDPHAPYQPPRSFFDRMSAPYLEKVLPVYDSLRQHCARLIRQGLGPGEIFFENLVGRYDGEIAHVDASVGRLFQILTEAGCRDRTLVVITADHGEEFLEHDYVEHGWTLYEESLRIPLIFWAPSLFQPQRVGEAVSTLDIFTAVTALWGIESESSPFRGRPLFTGSSGLLQARPDPGPILGELLVQHRSVIRSVIRGKWKYLAAQRWLPPEDRPQALGEGETIEGSTNRHTDIWGPVIHEELYDLEHDPGEETNLIGRYPEIQRQLYRIYLDYRRFCRDRGYHKIPALSPPGSLDPAEKEKLKSLGYM